MSKDLHQILGISKEASDLEIKNSYRKLAVHWYQEKIKSPENLYNFRGKFQNGESYFFPYFLYIRGLALMAWGGGRKLASGGFLRAK